MGRVKRSPIWLISDQEFIDRVDSSSTMTELLATFELKNKGGNYRTAWTRIKLVHVDAVEVERKYRANGYLARHQSSKERGKIRMLPNEEVFKEHSTYSRYHLKNRIIKFGLIPYICRDCLLEAEWNGKPLSLQLEHVNGVDDDNRLENLCFLCPNCHSQTDTYAGKNNKAR